MMMMIPDNNKSMLSQNGQPMVQKGQAKGRVAEKEWREQASHGPDRHFSPVIVIVIVIAIAILVQCCLSQFENPGTDELSSPPNTLMVVTSLGEGCCVIALGADKRAITIFHVKEVLH